MKFTTVISSLGVKDIAKAKEFYSNILGLNVEQDWMGLTISFPEGNKIFIYEKQDHEPANFTLLNFPVPDIDTAIDELTKQGVQFERYDNLPAPQDKKGVLRGKAAGMGPDIAWFTDPSGNILSILSDKPM